MTAATHPLAAAAIQSTEAQRRHEALVARVERWNAESAEKPGPKVRVYTANADGSVGVEDRER